MAVKISELDTTTAVTGDETIAAVQNGRTKGIGLGDIVPIRRTAAEIAATVTPTDYRYPPGDIRRYGTNTTPGTTDMTSAIQAALNVAKEAGGGTITFPDETFGISGTLTVYSYTRLVGNGTVIKAISAYAGAMVQFGTTTAVITDADTDPCEFSSIEGFEIDGNDLVTGKDWDPGALQTAGLDSALVYIWRNSTNNKVLNCKIHSAECDLLGSEDGSDFLEVRGCEIYGATTTSAATQFINLINIDGSEHAIIEGNNVYDLLQSGYSPASWGYALRLHATDHAVVECNRFASGWNVVLIDGRDNLIIKNKLSGGGARGLYLFENAFGCWQNTVIANEVDGNALTAIQEQNDADVDRNFVLFNTIRNATTALSIPAASASVVLGNKVFDSGGAAVADVTRLQLHKGSTADATSDLTAGIWTPGTITNTTNTSSTTIANAQYARVGNIVTFSGSATTTFAGAGAYEFRFSPPIASTFTDATDANGTGCTSAGDGLARILALASGAFTIRVVGNAAGAATQVVAFSGSYIVK